MLKPKRKRMRKSQVQISQSNLIEEPVFYEELLADLSKEPFAAFHVPLVLTRILVFTFLIVCFSSFSKGTVWLLFLILLSCQILYFIQTSKFRKFEWWPLHSIYVINEAFFLSFILVFGFMNSREDYEGCKGMYNIL